MKALPIIADRGGWRKDRQYDAPDRDGFYNGTVTEYVKATRSDYRTIKVRFHAYWVNDEGGVQITLNPDSRHRRCLGILSLRKARALLRDRFGIRYL